LYEIEHLKVAVMHGETEIRETTALLNLSYKKNASIEDAMQHDKGRFHHDTDERDTKITTLQSKVAVAEMREEHLLQQVQDIGLARDSLLKNQLRTSAELYASQECVCVRGWVGGCMGVVLQGVVACCSVWQCVAVCEIHIQYLHSLCANLDLLQMRRGVAKRKRRPATYSGGQESH